MSGCGSKLTNFITESDEEAEKHVSVSQQGISEPCSCCRMKRFTKKKPKKESNDWTTTTEWEHVPPPINGPDDPELFQKRIKALKGYLYAENHYQPESDAYPTKSEFADSCLRDYFAAGGTQIKFYDELEKLKNWIEENQRKSSSPTSEIGEEIEPEDNEDISYASGSENEIRLASDSRSENGSIVQPASGSENNESIEEIRPESGDSGVVHALVHPSESQNQEASIEEEFTVEL